LRGEGDVVEFHFDGVDGAGLAEDCLDVFEAGEAPGVVEVEEAAFEDADDAEFVIAGAGAEREAGRRRLISKNACHNRLNIHSKQSFRASESCASKVFAGRAEIAQTYFARVSPIATDSVSARTIASRAFCDSTTNSDFESSVPSKTSR